MRKSVVAFKASLAHIKPISVVPPMTFNHFWTILSTQHDKLSFSFVSNLNSKDMSPPHHTSIEGTPWDAMRKREETRIRKKSANKNKNKFVSESCGAVVVVKEVSYIQMSWNWDARQQPHFRLRLSFRACFKLKIWACFGLLGTHMTLLSAVDISSISIVSRFHSALKLHQRWEKSSAWAKLSYVRNEIRFSHSWIIFSAFYYSERIMKLFVSMCARSRCYDVSA